MQEAPVRNETKTSHSFPWGNPTPLCSTKAGNRCRSGTDREKERKKEGKFGFRFLVPDNGPLTYR